MAYMKLVILLPRPIVLVFEVVVVAAVVVAVVVTRARLRTAAPLAEFATARTVRLLHLPPGLGAVHRRQRRLQGSANGGTLALRVPQAGIIARRDVVHHTRESAATPPQPAAFLVVVHRRWPVPLVPSELPLPPIDEEGVPGCVVVGVPAGIHPLLRRELDVVVVRDGRPASRALSYGRNRHASGAQPPARGTQVSRRAGVVRPAQRLRLRVG